MFIFAPILPCTSSMHEFSNDWSIRQNNLQDWSSSDAIKQYIFCSISRDLRVDRRLPIGTGAIGEFLIEIPALNSIDCGNFERHTNPKAFWEWIMTLSYEPNLDQAFKCCERRKLRLSRVRSDHLRSVNDVISTLDPIHSEFLNIQWAQNISLRKPHLDYE